LKDIKLLAEYFMNYFGLKVKKQFTGLTDAKNRMVDYQVFMYYLLVCCCEMNAEREWCRLPGRLSRKRPGNRL